MYIGWKEIGWGVGTRDRGIYCVCVEAHSTSLVVVTAIVVVVEEMSWSNTQSYLLHT